MGHRTAGPQHLESGKSLHRLPDTGLFAKIPASWTPYAELMRLDRPAGFYAFYWHYAIGLAYAACLEKQHSDLSSVGIFGRALFLGLWVLIQRGAVCTWNDTLDQEYDRQVERTKHRPIARGAVNTFQAYVFTAAQLSFCLFLLAPLPIECTYYALAIISILGVYPLGKRFTDFPQVILGVGFAISISFSCAMIQADPFLQWNPSNSGPTARRSSQSALFCLHTASLLWTVIFDTVYAHQDLKDDVKAGVRSLAVRLGPNTKPALCILALAQVALLAYAGILSSFSIRYFVLSCFGAGAALFSMLRSVQLSRPSSCKWWFGPGSGIVGATMVLGLIAEYVGT